jgi:hypothetical protein
MTERGCLLDGLDLITAHVVHSCLEVVHAFNLARVN